MRMGNRAEMQVFEALEDRRMLAAPTVALRSFDVRDTAAIIEVEYTDPDGAGINLNTLGNNDLRLLKTSSTGTPYDRQGTLVSSATQGNGAVRAVYSFTATNGLWNAFNRGTYQISSVAGGVADNAGETTAATNLASYWLWWGTSRMVPSVSYSDDDGIEIEIEWESESGTGIPPVNPATRALVDVTTPAGTTRLTLIPRADDNNPNRVKYEATFAPPGGAWDFSDTGTYRVSLPVFTVAGGQDVQTDAITVASYWLWYTNPKAEFVSQQMRTSDWLVTMRYTDNQGINLDSVGNSDLKLLRPGNNTQTNSTLVSKTLNQDGSVTAVYAFAASGSVWSSADNGQRVLRLDSQQVLDTTGVAAREQTLNRYDFWFAALPQPFVSGLNANDATSARWNLAVDWTLPSASWTGAFLDGTVQITRPGQAPVTAQMERISLTNLTATTVRVNLRLTPAVGQQLQTGTYVVQASYTDPLGITRVLGVGSWWLAF